MGRCHNCGDWDHHARHCRRPLRTRTVPLPTTRGPVICYRCRKTGHYSDKCTTAIAPTIICYKCREPGHYSDKCTAATAPASSQQVSAAARPIPVRRYNKSPPRAYPLPKRTITCKLELGEMWGRDSIKIADGSMLDLLHRRLMTALIERGVLCPSDIDERARIPHIDVGGDQAMVARLRGHVLTISPRDVSIEPNLVRLPLPEGRHMTLAYKTDIGRRDTAVRLALDDIFTELACRQYL